MSETNNDNISNIELFEYEDVSYLPDHNSDEKKIIETFSKEMIESNNFGSINIRSLFPILLTWKNQDCLKKALDLYSSKNGFIVVYHSDGKILCNMHNQRKK